MGTTHSKSSNEIDDDDDACMEEKMDINRDEEKVKQGNTKDKKKNQDKKHTNKDQTDHHENKNDGGKKEKGKRHRTVEKVIPPLKAIGVSHDGELLPRLTSVGLYLAGGIWILGSPNGGPVVCSLSIGADDWIIHQPTGPWNDKKKENGNSQDESQQENEAKETSKKDGESASHGTSSASSPSATSIDKQANDVL